jgi:hypothetical protein
MFHKRRINKVTISLSSAMSWSVHEADGLKDGIALLKPVSEIIYPNYLDSQTKIFDIYLLAFRHTGHQHNSRGSLKELFGISEDKSDDKIDGGFLCGIKHCAHYHSSLKDHIWKPKWSNMVGRPLHGQYRAINHIK